MRPFHHYFERLENTIRSRKEIEITRLESKATRDIGVFRASMSFVDGSRLVVREDWAYESYTRIYERLEYAFHYQSADGTLIFRYDNSPHYPDLPSFPHHKHLRDEVVASAPPDLADVLTEIDALLYPAKVSNESSTPPDPSDSSDSSEPSDSPDPSIN